MEEYAKLCNVGADKRRRTEVLIFSGEKQRQKRLTCRRLEMFLQTYNNEKISLGTVVQLCAKKQKRRHTSLRYKGIAHIMFRKALKGYNLRLNADAHYSRTMYRLLDSVQKVTEDSVFFGRDDQTGFRLNIIYTHKQIGTKRTFTTRTDFVSKQATNLQVTSYNFQATESNPEYCVGIVRASFFPQKSS